MVSRQGKYLNKCICKSPDRANEGVNCFYSHLAEHRRAKGSCKISLYSELLNVSADYLNGQITFTMGATTRFLRFLTCVNFQTFAFGKVSYQLLSPIYPESSPNLQH
jgi:hypothetical protein